MKSEKIQLQLEPRTTVGKDVKKLRREGVVPVALCGKSIQPINAQVDERELSNIYRRAGLTTLVELTVPGAGKQQAFFHEVQRHPVTRRFLHVDFHVVDLKVEVTVDVPIVTVGENRLAERGDAIVTVPHQTLHVRALPTDLPHQIEVDISTLEDFHQSIYVRDLNLGDKVHILTAPDEVVVTLTASRMAAEEEALVAEAAESTESSEEESEPELVRGERKQDEDEE